MSLVDGESALRGALRGAGHLLPGARPGIDGHGPEFEAVVDGLWRAYADRAPAGTPVMAFGPLIDAAQFTATDYPRSFPQLVGEVEVFRGGDPEHRALIGDVDAGRDWTGYFEPSGMTLVPATCQNVYPRYAGTLEAPTTVFCRSWCFRHEPSEDPVRMWPSASASTSTWAPRTARRPSAPTGSNCSSTSSAASVSTWPPTGRTTPSSDASAGCWRPTSCSRA